MEFQARPRRRGLAIGDAVGEAYVELDPAGLARLEDAIRTRAVAGGACLKSPNVWRQADWGFKFYAEDRGLLDRVRRHAALRSARAQGRIRPVASPEPIAAFAFRTARGGFDGLLVTRFVAGRSLGEVWSIGRESRDALGRFLADMSERRVWHGDLHPGNLLWDGERWWLLDLDGLRSGPLRRLDPRREREAWTRLHFNLRLDPEFAAVHRAALGHLGRADRHGSEWAEIDVRAREIAASRGPDPWHGRGPA